MYGASAKSIGLAGQYSAEQGDAQNNYYHPSLLAFAKNNVYSISTISNNTEFKNIENVVVQNQLSDSTSSAQYGEIATNYKATHNLLFHANLPLFKRRLTSRLGISFITPINKLIEMDTGEQYKPEYVMYRARNQRTLFFLNVAKPITENQAASIGLLTGIETSGSSQIIARGLGDTEPSLGRMQFESSPIASLALSWSMRFGKDNLAITFQDKMENKLKTQAYGFSPTGAGKLLYRLNLESLHYFDPRILRISYQKTKQKMKFISTLELQDWSDYKTPKLTIDGQTGFNSSVDYEQIDAKMIMVPKFAISYSPNEINSYSLGLHYRPSPFSSNLNQAGNSIDPDIIGLSLGVGHKFKILNENFTAYCSASYYHLVEQQINKTNGLEDGTSGQKIGYPGYEIGGSVQTLALGLDWMI